MTSKNLKVLITGASGLLGRQILNYLENNSLQLENPVDNCQNYVFECLGLCHSRAKNKLRPVDLNNFNQIDDVIQEFRVCFEYFFPTNYDSLASRTLLFMQQQLEK